MTGKLYLVKPGASSNILKSVCTVQYQGSYIICAVVLFLLQHIGCKMKGLTSVRLRVLRAFVLPRWDTGIERDPSFNVISNT